MFFKHHHPKIIIAIAIIAIFIATFANNKRVDADLTTNMNWCGANVGSIGITLAECQSLALLYEETSGYTWTNHNNWFVTTLLTGWGAPNSIIIDGGHLTRLNLNNNNLTGTIIQGLDNLTFLTGLNLSANYLHGVDVSNNILLESLAVLTNQLTSIDVSTNTLLKSLYVGANSLTTVNVTNNPNLIILHVGGTQLTGINLSNNPQLQELYILANNFTWFDASNLPALRILNAAGNDLTGLDVSQNIHLTGLYLYTNNLVQLDVSHNTGLVDLWLMNNDLTGLDLSSNSLLKELYLDNNSLTGLDISHNTGLLELWSRNNGIRTLTVASAGDYPLPVNTNYLFSGNNLCYLETTTPQGLNRVTFLNQQEPNRNTRQFCEPENFSSVPNQTSIDLSWGTADGYFDTSTSYYELSIDAGLPITLSGTDVSYNAPLGSIGPHTFKLCAHTILDSSSWVGGAGLCSIIIDSLLPPQQQGGGGGGGGSDEYGGGLVLDECPNGDSSGSNHDGSCGPQSEVVIDEVNPEEPMHPAPSIPDTVSLLPAGALNCPNPLSQYNEAFEFAFHYGITTMPTCAKAYMNGKLIRKDAAKMIVNFVTHIMGKQPDRSIRCAFTDMYGADKDAQKYAIEACQLGLMGLKGDGTPAKTFSPDRIIDKKQFSTIISRILFGDTYNTATNNKKECWYCGHVNALWNVGIIKNTSGLNDQFNRGFAFIMLMRAVKQP